MQFVLKLRVFVPDLFGRSQVGNDMAEPIVVFEALQRSHCLTALGQAVPNVAVHAITNSMATV